VPVKPVDLNEMRAICQLPTKISWVRSASQTIAFFGAYLIFAVVGSAVSIACLLPAALFRGVPVLRFGQKLIHGLFAFFVGYLRCCGLIKLDASELSALQDSRGLIIVANHPCLLDAVLVVSQLPQVVCLMKGSLIHNVVLCGTAQLAGYVPSDSGLGLVKKCRQRLTQGANLLVFPEGTRSIFGQMQPFKTGFALVASLAQSPVQTLIITTDSNFLSKGWPFFQKPSFPVRYSLSLGKRFDPAPGMDVKAFGCTVESYFHNILARLPKAAASFPQ
jgi:1-acyl-sn-glycerol-3-phosphate acyltransferase